MATEPLTLVRVLVSPRVLPFRLDASCLADNDCFVCRRLDLNNIAEFEIRRSDLPTFQQLNASGGNFSEPSCSDTTAEVVEAMSVKLCVIDGEHLCCCLSGSVQLTHILH